MINVRFYRAYSSNNPICTCINHKARGQFLLTFKSVEDLVSWFKRQQLHMKKLQQSCKRTKINRYRLHTYVVVPVSLEEDLTAQEYVVFLRKYHAMMKSFRK